MKGTEKIIAHIRADAEARSGEILAEAERQCAAVREDFEKQAGELYAERIRAGVKACQDRLDSQQRLGRMESKKSVLAVKQEMVEQCFSDAKAQILALPEERYVEFLASLAAKASSSGDEEILLNARDRAAIGEKVVTAANEKLGGGKLRLGEGSGAFDGGLLLRRGSIEVNCTAELLVELCRGEMSAQLAEVLFG